MKHGVSKQTLLIAAGIVWIAAGANILRIGIVTWQHGSELWLCRMAEVTAVFIVFFVFVFRRLYYKHTRRIEQKPGDENCPFAFFDIKGWVMMTLMITLGILMRIFHLLPERFISVFYSGLSVALISTGVLFVRYWWKNRVRPRN